MIGSPNPSEALQVKYDREVLPSNAKRSEALLGIFECGVDCGSRTLSKRRVPGQEQSKEEQEGVNPGPGRRRIRVGLE